MSKLFRFASLSILLAVGAMLVGCSNGQQAAPPEASREESAASGHEGHDHEHAGHEGHGQYEEALARLSPADQALAEKQEVCPVSGQPLGSMGTPYKVTVEGREVLLCCSGCESQIKENPEKYLAKLPQ